MIALEVREAGRKQYEFLALLGHELRNPLAAITAALKVLRRCGDDGTTRDLVQGVLERQTHQLGCLIEQLQGSPASTTVKRSYRNGWWTLPR